MRDRNAVRRPPFVMYYRTCPLRAVRRNLTASGFTVTTVPLTALGQRETAARSAGLSSPAGQPRPDFCARARRNAIDAGLAGSSGSP